MQVSQAQQARTVHLEKSEANAGAHNISVAQHQPNIRSFNVQFEVLSWYSYLDLGCLGKASRSCRLNCFLNRVPAPPICQFADRHSVGGNGIPGSNNEAAGGSSPMRDSAFSKTSDWPHPASPTTRRHSAQVLTSLLWRCNICVEQFPGSSYGNKLSLILSFMQPRISHLPSISFARYEKTARDPSSSRQLSISA